MVVPHGARSRADPVAGRLPPPDGRWQRGATVEGLYLASDEATVWAEWYRHLAEAGIPPNQQMPRDLWTWMVDPGLEVADLTSGERLGRVGLAIPRPGRQKWPPYQRIGEDALARGLAGPARAQCRLFTWIACF
jgi:hypothetical protein